MIVLIFPLDGTRGRVNKSSLFKDAYMYNCIADLTFLHLLFQIYTSFFVYKILHEKTFCAESINIVNDDVLRI